MAAQVTPSEQNTFSVDYANPLLRHVRTLPPADQERAQEAFQRVSEAIGVTLDILSVPHARIGRDAGLTLMRLVLEVSDDPLAPLLMGLDAKREDLGILAYIGATAETLGQSLRTSARYLALVDDAAAMEIAVDNGLVTASLQWPTAPDTPPESAELAIGNYFAAATENLGFPSAPVSVHFRHAPRANPERYAQLLRAPVHFEQPFDGWVFPAEALPIPQVSADPALHRLLCIHADELMQRLPRRRSTLQEVRELMLQRLADTPSTEKLAASLSIGERTLRRRLQSHSHTVTTLLDDVRRDEATRLLTHSHMSVSEVAFALGFSQPSAFHRAFRRWFAMSPVTYRRTTVSSPLRAFLIGPASEAG